MPNQRRTGPPITCKDKSGLRIRRGDIVRIVGKPDLSHFAPTTRKEMLPVFEYLIGKRRKVLSIDDNARVEFMVRLRRGVRSEYHWIWLEGELLKRVTRRLK